MLERCIIWFRSKPWESCYGNSQTFILFKILYARFNLKYFPKEIEKLK